jgi:choline dehydrogenase
MSTDFVVAGGGTAGATLAGLLAELTDAHVVLIEAGPDYGPFDGEAWPEALVDARHICWTHGWGYDSGSLLPNRLVPFSRAKVLGGCSAHNGCAAI